MTETVVKRLVSKPNPRPNGIGNDYTPATIENNNDKNIYNEEIKKESLKDVKHREHYQCLHSRTPSCSFGICGPTYAVDQVPENFHEMYILHGYRHPKSSFTQCVLSLFDVTNETLNAWTHFLPAFYFIWVWYGLSQKLDFINDSYTWPLLVYMFVCCVFPLASAVAHTFNTMSDKARHICFFLDYSALSLLSLGVAIAYRAYAFPQELRNTIYGDVFIGGAVVNSLLCVIISCETRFMKPSHFRKFLRLACFALPYLYDSIPLYYRLIFCSVDECALISQYLFFRHHFFAFSSAFLYATHLPERLQPGRFDFIGHSHQLFHVCSILATMDHLQGLLDDMRDRSEELKANWEFQSPNSSINTLAVVLVLNTLVIFIFSIRRLPQVTKS